MRIITIPEPLTVRLPHLDENGENKTKVARFQEFVSDTIMSDPKFMKKGSAKDLKRAIKILDSLMEANGTWTLEDADWERLHDVCEQPSGTGWNGFFGPQFWPFIQAILEADTAK